MTLPTLPIDEMVLDLQFALVSFDSTHDDEHYMAVLDELARIRKACEDQLPDT